MSSTPDLFKDVRLVDGRPFDRAQLNVETKNIKRRTHALLGQAIFSDFHLSFQYEHYWALVDLRHDVDIRSLFSPLRASSKIEELLEVLRKKEGNL